MPKGKVPYQYAAGDTPVSLAQQWNVLPSDVIRANPGAWPASTGQVIMQPPPAAVPMTFQQMAQQSANVYNPNAYNTPLQQYAQPAPQTPAYLHPRGLGGQEISPTPYNNPIYGANGQPIIVPRGTYGQTFAAEQPQYFRPYTLGPAAPTGPTSYAARGNSSDYMNNLVSRAVSGEYDSLTPGEQEKIDELITQIEQNRPTTINADPSQSPGGRFIQVGEKRWERNKNGRLVQVQYIGGGSWRNKRVVSGGKNQSNGGNAPRNDPNARLTGFGLVNFNVGGG